MITEIPSRFRQWLAHSFADTCHVTRFGIYTWPVGIGGEDTSQTVERWSGTGGLWVEGHKWIMFFLYHLILINVSSFPELDFIDFTKIEMQIKVLEIVHCIRLVSSLNSDVLV